MSADRWIDLRELLDSDEGGPEWLYPEFLAMHRGHSMYAKAKQGKSLLILFVAALLAVFRDDVDVIYLDYEMTRADLKDRLLDMGYSPSDDLSRLHYAMIPSLPPLDSAAGAKALHEWISEVWDGKRHLLVVIDTISRAVDGEENSNDTIRNFYRYTGAVLKRLEATWIRLDHAGKDARKGARGGSAKVDDVDIVWWLTSTARTTDLTLEASRVSWAPEKVTFVRTTDPLLCFSLPAAAPPSARAREVIDQLDALGVPVDVTVRDAVRALKEAYGSAAARSAVSEAVRLRKAGTTTPAESPPSSGTTGGTEGSTSPLTSTGTTVEPSGTKNSVPSGTSSPPEGEPVPEPAPAPDNVIHWPSLLRSLEEEVA